MEKSFLFRHLPKFIAGIFIFAFVIVIAQVGLAIYGLYFASTLSPGDLGAFVGEMVKGYSNVVDK